MFCKKCGREIEEGEKFCAKCGTAVEDAATVDKPVKHNRRKKSKVRIIMAGVLVVTVIVMIFMYRSSNKYSGYYIYESDSDKNFVAMRIEKDKVLVCRKLSRRMDYLYGYLEKDDEDMYIYLKNIEDDSISVLATIELADNDKLYILSKSDKDIFKRVSKKKYKSYFKAYLSEGLPENVGWEFIEE